MKKPSNNIYADINELSRLQYHARGFSFSPNQPVNSVLSGKNVSRLRGRGLNFEELRHYRPGDDIRSMDWKVTRRTGKPHIKVYTEERERNVYLIINQASSMFFGSTGKMKSVIAAEVSSLIAWQITQSGDRIGGIIFNDDDVKVVPAKRGKQHVLNFLTEIVKKNHQLKVGNEQGDNSKTPEGFSINDSLKKVSQIAGHDALIIIIGDGNGWNKTSNDYLKKLRQHNEIIAVHIYDQLEMELPKMTNMIVSDGNYQIQFSSEKQATQEKYQALAQAQLTNYAQSAKRYRIPMITLNTLEPTEQQLRSQLGKVY